MSTGGRRRPRLFRIASDQAPATEFTDTGLAERTGAAAGRELRSREFLLAAGAAAGDAGNGAFADIGGQRRAGDGGEPVSRHDGADHEGSRRGAGADDRGEHGDDVTVAPAWEVEPDATSRFVVAEGGWRFGALTKSSPVQFAVPNRAGETVQIMGRAANVNDVECAAELSTVTRWQIGGSGSADAHVPPTPYFGLGATPGGGTVELSGVSFADLTNTHTITSATLTMYYWDELQGTPLVALIEGVSAEDEFLDLNIAAPAEAGTFVQVEREVMRVESAQQRHAVPSDAGRARDDGGGARCTESGVPARSEDGDRAVCAGILRQPVQRELELPDPAAGCADRERGAVCDQSSTATARPRTSA